MVYPPVWRDNPRALASVLSTAQAHKLFGFICKARGLSFRTGGQIVLCLTCTVISSVDLAHFRVTRAKDFGI